ncbi:hypothetical protein TSUD_152600 [Trifolium subterraneum]|uniref:Uncharacterized protein n=1 Tax=Trifolium subterraneum TaxID=3900 RepID=A0A2Z6MMW4_TRISU|nr:hypothetical protein TSUD_152600 [Trifolium subterraneum]
MMSFKMNWLERNAASQTIWSLPPSFAVEVYCGVTIEELIEKYGKNWMPHFENLKYIYILIDDCVGNWFLMVAAIDDQWQVITKMLQANNYPPEFLREVDKDNWDMADPVGLVSEGFCQHSAVWVLQWLSMGSSFTPNIHVMLKEDVVRMKAAMDLLLVGLAVRYTLLFSKIFGSSSDLSVSEDISVLLLAGFAGLVVGACSMAIGEFVSVYTQYDIDIAQIKRERELANNNNDEESSEREKLPNSFQAALASALAFSVGALMSLLAAAFIKNYKIRMGVVAAVVSFALLVFGSVGALIGKTPVMRSCVRVLIGGWMAMVITFGVTKLIGTTGL